VNLLGKIVYLAVPMNAPHGFGQELVRYQTVQVDGFNVFYREAGPTNGPVILLLHPIEGIPSEPYCTQRNYNDGG